MIQQLRNPFLRHFSLGTPQSNYPFINNLLMDILGVLLYRVSQNDRKKVCGSEGYQNATNQILIQTHLYQEPADGYTGSFFLYCPRESSKKVILAAIGMFPLGCKGILRSIVQKTIMHNLMPHQPSLSQQRHNPTIIFSHTSGCHHCIT